MIQVRQSVWKGQLQTNQLILQFGIDISSPVVKIFLNSAKAKSLVNLFSERVRQTNATIIHPPANPGARRCARRTLAPEVQGVVGG